MIQDNSASASSGTTQLKEIVGALSSMEFLSDYYGKRWFLSTGEDRNFGSLFSWADINSVLYSQRLESPRLRIAHRGTVVSPDEYLQWHTSRRGVQIPRVDVGHLHAILRRGSTVVIDDLQETNQLLYELCSAFERQFKESVSANAYVTRGPGAGFNTHWDAHEIFVIQVEGSKRWELYAPTREFPLFKDLDPNLEAPEDIEPTVIVLNEGDILYIPRGWWHNASAQGVPSIHVTFGLSPRTGIDFLEWLTDRLRSSQAFRQDLPRFNSKALSVHSITMRDEILAAMSSESLYDFLENSDERALARARTNLPLMFETDSSALNGATRIRIQFPRAVVRADDQFVVLAAGGKRWTYDALFADALTLVTTGETVTVEEIAATVANVSQTDVCDALYPLLDEGVLRVVNDDDGRD